MGKHVSRPFIGILLGLVLNGLNPNAAWAQTRGPRPTGNIWDWQRAWSLPKWLVLITLLVVLWWLCFHVVFPALLSRRRAPWPRTAFGRTLAAYWLLSICVFVMLFTVLSDAKELLPPRIYSALFPLTWTWLNANWVWFGLMLIGVCGASLIAYLLRHRDAQATYA